MESDNGVASVRRFNRYYTRKIGVLQEGLLDSPYSLTEARIIFEIANQKDVTASAIGEQLGLDPGYLSRTLNKLEQLNLINKTPAENDRRQRLIRLTAEGQKAYSMLDQRSSQEIGQMLQGLLGGQVQRLVKSMRTIETILDPPPSQANPFILRPHRPGDMGWVIGQHGLVYSQEYGWDVTFEAFVAQICADFINNFDPKKENCWIAETDGEPVGCVFCVKQSDEVAKLRMLLVSVQGRGLGLGTHLVRECIQFARRCGYQKMVLWTNDILVEARHIYEKFRFQLVEEEKHHSFGQDLVGQNWELSL